MKSNNGKVVTIFHSVLISNSVLIIYIQIVFISINRIQNHYFNKNFTKNIYKFNSSNFTNDKHLK